MLRCAIAGVEAVAADTPRTFGRHTHAQYGIGVIERGAQKSLSGRGVVEAGAGDVITVNPGEVHDGMPLSDAGRAWRMLYFDPAIVADIAGDLPTGPGDAEFIHPVLRDAVLSRRVRHLFAQMTAPQALHDALLREQLLLAVLADALQTAQRTASIPDGIQRARARIDDDPAAAVSLQDLAHDTGLSRFQVLRGFAKATGLTPHAYLMQRRVAMARRLIAPGLPLAEAAAACGFADQSHMTRLFVREYGVSPRMVADAAG
jgi:AraC-like DNA-binding protein